jgi:hypothetical protein
VTISELRQRIHDLQTTITPDTTAEEELKIRIEIDDLYNEISLQVAAIRAKEARKRLEQGED